jgi:hypothetical protein
LPLPLLPLVIVIHWYTVAADQGQVLELAVKLRLPLPPLALNEPFGGETETE